LDAAAVSRKLHPVHQRLAKEEGFLAHAQASFAFHGMFKKQHSQLGASRKIAILESAEEFKPMRLLSLCLVVLCLSLSPLRADAAAPSQPNIVFILADDLGYGDVQAFNPQRGKIKTPNCDRLAAQGMTFTDCHGGSSVCTPTRYGLLTGRYAWRTRLQRGVLDGYPEPLIAWDRLTLPKLLKQQGYHTAAMGKWHLGFTVQEGAGGAGKPKTTTASVGMTTTNGPTTRGFDEFFGFQHSRSMEGFFVNDRVTESVKPVDMLPKLTRLAAEHILQRAKTRQPFFLYLALNSPHTPIVPSLEWQGKSGLGDYGDYVMETDWAVGEVLAALDKAGVASNTLVVFASDNGCSPAAGTQKLESRGHFPSAQSRGYKSDIWDGGHRIPFIARWPGEISAGSRCAAMICLTDFMATTAEILGVRLPGNCGRRQLQFSPRFARHGPFGTNEHRPSQHPRPVRDSRRLVETGTLCWQRWLGCAQGCRCGRTRFAAGSTV
jgi:arylsulfatase A-like enzyme